MSSIGRCVRLQKAQTLPHIFQEKSMRSIILFVLSMLMVTAVHAGGGFKGPGAAAIITQAKQVQDARDDAPCQLEGYIVERASGNIDDAHKKYVFRDDSGTVIVEIEKHVFAGREITPQLLVRLHGEVEKEYLRKNEVEVESLEIVQK
jgi:uncharacterized protein (TIGR00156 family)